MVEKLLNGIEWEKVVTVGKAYGHEIDAEAEKVRVKNLILHRMVDPGVSMLHFRDVGRWRAENAEGVFVIELVLTGTAVVEPCEQG